MFQKIGFYLSDLIVGIIGTWRFVFVYSISMATWILLHKQGYLSIDGSDFMKWNLWLSYFAGIQASIVLMSSARQARLEQQEHHDNYKVDLDTLKSTVSVDARVQLLSKKIEVLENIIEHIMMENKK